MANPKRRRRRGRRYYRKPRRRRSLFAMSQAPNRRMRRYRRRRRNPILPTGRLTQALTLGAGFLAAPMVSDLIPWKPASKLGEWAKMGVVVALGSQIVRVAVGKKYADALMWGGLLRIGVDVLQSQIPFFGGGGLSRYYPADEELIAQWGSGLPAPAEIRPPALAPGGRLEPRFH